MTTSRLKQIVDGLAYEDDAQVAAQLGNHAQRVERRMASVRHKLAVLSGKGGVGKSMTAANLALALARAGHRVGVLDVDLNGPSIPRLLGLAQHAFEITDEGALPAVGPLGVKVASMGFLLRGDAPLRWRGPLDLSPVWLGAMELNAIRELIADVVWGELDYLIADLPPGAAADKPPAITGYIRDLAGALVVTTPSIVASDVVSRSIGYARDAGIRVLGVVENMASYRCTHCGEEGPLFAGDVAAICSAIETPLLASIPFDPALLSSFDIGRPLLDTEHPTLARYDELARAVEAAVDIGGALAHYL